MPPDTRSGPGHKDPATDQNPRSRESYPQGNPPGQDGAQCRRCGRGGRLISTNVGPQCKKCADHLPPHLRKPAIKSSNTVRGVAKTGLAPSRAPAAPTGKKKRRKR